MQQVPVDVVFIQNQGNGISVLMQPNEVEGFDDGEIWRLRRLPSGEVSLVVGAEPPEFRTDSLLQGFVHIANFGDFQTPEPVRADHSHLGKLSEHGGDAVDSGPEPAMIRIRIEGDDLDLHVRFPAFLTSPVLPG